MLGPVPGRGSGLAGPERPEIVAGERHPPDTGFFVDRGAQFSCSSGGQEACACAAGEALTLEVGEMGGGHVERPAISFGKLSGCEAHRVFSLFPVGGDPASALAELGRPSTSLPRESFAAAGAHSGHGRRPSSLERGIRVPSAASSATSLRRAFSPEETAAVGSSSSRLNSK
jgi:hypothetical protein